MKGEDECRHALYRSLKSLKYPLMVKLESSRSFWRFLSPNWIH